MLINFKHNIDELAKKVLDNMINTLHQQKKELHQKAADTIKEDIKENVYEQEFQKVVNPDSSWQRLKAELGFPGKPGHFTGSTLDALIAEATEEIGQVTLTGKWPNRKGSDILNKVTLTSSGLNIGPFRSDKLGIRVGGILFPMESFQSKEYGSWIGEDIKFMKIRPEAQNKIMADMEREIQQIIANLIGR